MGSLIVVTLLAALLCCFPSSKANKIPLVIDTDLGDYMDDTWAIAYVLSRSDVFDTRLIVTATMNTTGRACIVAKFLEEVNRTDIDVGIGVETPNGDLKPDGVGPQWNWASSYPLNQYPGRLHTNGVAAMMEEFSKGTEENPIWLLELAPNTNLAQAIALDPSLTRRVRVVAMGGSINIGYSGSPPPTAEYNIAQNTTASQTVFSATWANATILAPVDTSEYLHIAGNLYQKFYAAATSKQHVLAATLLDTYTVWYETGGKDQPCDYPFGPKVGTPGLFDLLAAFVAEKVATSAKKSRPSVPYLSLEEEHLLVNDTGFTVPVGSSDVPLSYAALEWVPSKDVGVAEVGNEVVDSLIQAP